MLQKNKNTFYCFSPPVMIATVIIEVALLLFAFFKYKKSPTTYLAIALLFFLALFQFAEYNICEQWLINGDVWSRIGFASITMLPPLGLHLSHVIAGKNNTKLVALGYLTGFAFVAAYLLIKGIFIGNQCTGNYIIFSLTPPTGILFSLYYYGWLLTGIITSLKLAKKTKPPAASALRWQAIGYASFMVPTAIVNSTDPSTIAGIPSIMCGFAVLYALILGLKVLPNSAKKV